MIILCFYLVSGLKINLFTFIILGVGVDQSEVISLANINACEPTMLHFTYLGILVGDSMARVKSWDAIIDRFRKRL